jgi:hypothetical protein
MESAPKPTLVFDIEVAGFAWEEIDEITRNYLVSREKDPKLVEAVPERTALCPGLGKVIAIGIWKIEPGSEDDTGLLLLEGEPAERREWEKVPRSSILRGSERDLLAMFWRIVSDRRRRLVSFNGRGYDGPVLMTRSAQLATAPTRNLVPYRYDLGDHCDLMDVLSFQGAARERFSLDYWCRRFDVESPKGKIDGSQVARAYREGRIEEIGEYCLRDVRATAELYRRLERTLLPLFQGGR